MKPAICISVVLALSAASAPSVDALSTAATPVVTPAAVPSLGASGGSPLATPVASGWRVREADHICGLKNPNHLSHPAAIDFDEVMGATEEMKTLVREGIDRSSPRGQQLVSRATRRVTDAAKAVMAESGHCSIWKSISHSDGRSIPAVTAEVRRNL